MKNGQARTRARTQQANKRDLAQALAFRLNLPPRVAMTILDGVLDSVTSLLKEKKKVAVKEFGTWEHRVRKGRSYIHPRTGETVDVASKSTVYFRPSDRLKENVQ